MVGAVSVLLVILRTAMDAPTKKFSPLCATPSIFSSVICALLVAA